MNIQEDTETADSIECAELPQKPELGLYQWRVCEWVSAVFSILGWIVATIDYETRYSEERNHYNCVQKPYGYALRWIDTSLTVVALMFLVLRHTSKREWNVKKLSVASFTQRVPMLRFWIRLGVEVIVLCLFPYPYSDGEFYVDQRHRKSKWSIEFVKSDVCYTASELLYSLMFLRFFFVLRAVINMSRFMDGRSKRICKHFGVKANMRFTMRTLFRSRPYSLFFLFAVPTALLAAMLIRLFERPYVLISSQDFPYYPNTVYYVYISMTTIAYGDFYSWTQLGRLGSILIGIWGMGIFSMMIYVIDKAISQSKTQRQAFQAIKRTRVAAILIESFFVYLRLKRRNTLSKPILHTFYDSLKQSGRLFRVQMQRITELQALKERKQKTVLSRLDDLEQALLRTEIRAGTMDALEVKLAKVKTLCVEFGATVPIFAPLATLLPPANGLANSNMERANFFQLTTAQLHAVNAKLPTGFFMEQNRAAKGSAPAFDLFPARNKRPPPVDPTEKIGSLLSDLKAHKCAAPFLGSSKSHMNLSKIEEREYATLQEFTTDVRKMLNQGFQAYKPGSAEYQMVADLSDFFEKTQGRTPRTERTIRADPPPAKVELPKTRGEEAKAKADNGTVPEDCKKPAKPMSFQEKQTLASHIRQLEKQYLVHIIDIVSGHNRKGMKDQFEFDIDTLPPDVCQELKEYVKKCRNEQSGEKKHKSKKRHSSHSSASPSSSSSSSSSEFDEDNGAKASRRKGKSHR